MRKAGVGLLLCASLASSCSGTGENIIQPSPAPDLTPTTAAISTTVLAAAPATTSTTEPEPTTTTLPILCPHLPHPQHHDYCPVATTAELRRQTPTPASSESTTALPYNGWAIPEYIVSCETGGTFDWYAYNPSGASGPYQLMPMHFDGELAMNQSREAQHAKAAALWNGGKGKSHWQECL